MPRFACREHPDQVIAHNGSCKTCDEEQRRQKDKPKPDTRFNDDIYRGYR